MLFALATARIDFGSGFDSSLRALLILFSVSALAWLLQEGMVAYSYDQAEGVFVGGRNRDLVGIAPGHPNLNFAARDSNSNRSSKFLT